MYIYSLFVTWSYFTLDCSSLVDLDAALSEVSSAYIRAFVYCRLADRSLINNKKSRGPRIDPWGTPQVIFLVLKYNLLPHNVDVYLTNMI